MSSFSTSPEHRLPISHRHTSRRQSLLRLTDRHLTHELSQNARMSATHCESGVPHVWSDEAYPYPCSVCGNQVWRWCTVSECCAVCCGVEEPTPAEYEEDAAGTASCALLSTYSAAPVVLDTAVETEIVNTARGSEAVGHSSRNNTVAVALLFAQMPALVPSLYSAAAAALQLVLLSLRQSALLDPPQGWHYYCYHHLL